MFIGSDGVYLRAPQERHPRFHSYGARKQLLYLCYKHSAPPEPVVSGLCAIFNHLATRLTSRFDTTIVLTISLPSSFACTRSLASAASFIASSVTSAGTITRATSLPFN